MSNLYRGPSIDASYQIRFIWSSGFRGEDFFRNHIWQALYKDCSFSPDPLADMAAQTILVADWLIPKKSSTLKPLGQMNRNVVGSIYGRPSIKIAHFGSVNKHSQHRQSVLLIGRFLKNLLL